jgi:hypothetical protein
MENLFSWHSWFGLVLGAFSYLIYYFIIKPVMFLGGLFFKFAPFILRFAIFLLVLWGMSSCIVSLFEAFALRI